MLYEPARISVPRDRLVLESRAQQAEEERRAASWTRRFLSAVGGVILATGVVGTAVSAYVQWRSWAYQSGVAKIEKDAASAVAALENLDRIIDEKFLSTYDMDDAIKKRSSGDELDRAVNRFYAANKAWEQQHAILSSTLQIAVDSLFGIRNVPLHPAEKDIDCESYLLKDQQPNGDDPLAARNLLEIAYTCHTILKNKIDERLRARDANNGIWPDDTRDPDPKRLVLGHLWRLGSVLQCMMVERVLEIRHQSPRVALIPFAVGTEPRGYQATEDEHANEQQCLKTYKTDKDFGLAAVKP
jgi:hypothetical protein